MAARLTEAIAEFAAAMNEASPPAGAVEIVRTGFTDCLGVLIAGRNEPAVAGATKFVRTRRGPGESRILFGRERASAGDAALVNATAAHALDFDDYAFANHPSAVLVPTVVAAGERSGASGKRLVAAYVAGYEVWAELMTREPDHLHSKGWHPTPIFGAVAAAAAAGCVFGLDRTTMRHAVALSASFAGGVMENFGTMAKPLHGGRAAQQGLEAVAFAMAGIDGSATAIEGDRGLLRALSPKGNVDVTSAPAFGERWHILKHKLNIKKYPTVGASQRTIDSILTTLKTMPIEPGRIRAIRPLISVKQASVMQFHRPKTALEAKFSLEFAVAAALLHRAVDLRVLSDAVVQSPAMQAMMDRVAIETTEESDPGYPIAAPIAIVRITLDDGKVIATEPIRRASGHADAPLTRERLWAKFADCAAAGGVAGKQARRYFDLMQSIDTLENAGDIAELAA